MDEVYRGYRITISHNGSWTARIASVRGAVVPLTATASDVDGAAVCMERARATIDRYLAFLREGGGGGGGEEA